MTLTPGIPLFGAANVNNGLFRPTVSPNAWVAAPDDKNPKLWLEWDQPQTIREVVLAFDTDYDHPMESSLMGHPESTMPFCVQHYQLCNDRGEMVYEMPDNHQTINKIVFDPPLVTSQLVVEPRQPSPQVPAAIFEVQVY
jgi:hypothetical protein